MSELLSCEECKVSWIYRRLYIKMDQEIDQSLSIEHLPCFSLYIYLKKTSLIVSITPCFLSSKTVLKILCVGFVLCLFTNTIFKYHK